MHVIPLLNLDNLDEHLHHHGESPEGLKAHPRARRDIGDGYKITEDNHPHVLVAETNGMHDTEPTQPVTNSAYSHTDNSFINSIANMVRSGLRAFQSTNQIINIPQWFTKHRDNVNHSHTTLPPETPNIPHNGSSTSTSSMAHHLLALGNNENLTFVNYLIHSISGSTLYDNNHSTVINHNTNNQYAQNMSYSAYSPNGRSHNMTYTEENITNFQPPAAPSLWEKFWFLGT
ncbi:hypothetical protein ACRRVB_04480 [Candidatus Cardinium hertigii]|uniref:hypothetical protein n=1 Tax=Candidatus Cardinium hertigii TaxID=247481 RepID=UPI003D7E229D